MVGNVKYKLFLLSLLVLGSQSVAKELEGPYVGVIPMGMGRAYSAVADDWLALHYNPAGLALVRRVDVQPLGLEFEANSQVVNGSATLKTMTDKNTSTASKMNSLAGKHLDIKATNISQLTFPGFALAALINGIVDFDLQNQARPNTNLRYTRDIAFMAGAGIGFGTKKQIRIGGTIKIINRTGTKQEIGIDQIGSMTNGSLLQSFQKQGVGYGGDVGFQYRLNKAGRAEYTIAAVWHDIGKTSFGPYTSTARPMRVEDNLVAGFAMRFPIGGKVNRRVARRGGGQERTGNSFTVAADYSHINYTLDQEHLPKRFHFGLNLDLPILTLQAGVNQTSLTFGTSFDLGIFKISAATYGEEIGSYAGQQRDRRYVVSLSSSLGVSNL